MIVFPLVSDISQARNVKSKLQYILRFDDEFRKRNCVTIFFYRVDDGDGGFDLVVPSPLGSGSKLRRLLGVRILPIVGQSRDRQPTTGNPSGSTQREMLLIFKVETGER